MYICIKQCNVKHILFPAVLEQDSQMLWKDEIKKRQHVFHRLFVSVSSFWLCECLYKSQTLNQSEKTVCNRLFHYTFAVVWTKELTPPMRLVQFDKAHTIWQTNQYVRTEWSLITEPYALHVVHGGTMFSPMPQSTMDSALNALHFVQCLWVQRRKVL